jgi:hypothetical protein
MCQKNTREYIRFNCGHAIPKGACNNYSFRLEKCFGEDLNHPQTLNLKAMADGGSVDHRCGYCKTGKDVCGDYAFGAKWEHRGPFRK